MTKNRKRFFTFKFHTKLKSSGTRSGEQMFEGPESNFMDPRYFFSLFMCMMRITCICGYNGIHVDIRIIRNRMANPNFH